VDRPTSLSVSQGAAAAARARENEALCRSSGRTASVRVSEAGPSGDDLEWSLSAQTPLPRRFEEEYVRTRTCIQVRGGPHAF
jgi:hypothetical protein